MAKRVTRLASLFRPERYLLHLSLDRKKMQFTGTVRITGTKTGRPSKRITLHHKQLRIIKAEVTMVSKRGEPSQITISRINSHAGYDELRLHSDRLLRNGLYEIHIAFAGVISSQMHGLYPSNFTESGIEKQLLATQFEPHHAREVFPCIDEPEAKAVFELSITDDSNVTALSNTPIQGTKTAGGRTTTTFEPTPVMSSYLLAFVTGVLTYKQTISKNGTLVRAYATPAHKKSLDFSLSTAVRVLEYFEDYFGTAYPLDKLDLVALPDFTAGAMENWGLITFREQALLVDPESSSVPTKQMVALVIAHELSHQWFGNLVTMQWWNDLWLNESFAKLMEYLAIETLFPEWQIWRTFMEREYLHAMNRDAMPDIQPIHCDITHPDEINTLFDPAIVYAKGAAVLNMLRHYIGDHAFRKGLHKYFESFAYKNTETKDLWNSLSGASKKNVAAFMDPWLKQPGYPVLQVSHDPNQQTLQVSQSRFVIASTRKHTEYRESLWPIILEASQQLSNGELNQAQAEFSVQGKTDNVPLVINSGSSGYYVVQYTNEQHRRQLHTAIKTNRFSSTDRNYLLQCAYLLQKGRYMSLVECLQLLEAYRNEMDEKTWQTIAAILGETKRLVRGSDATETAFKQYCALLAGPLYAALGWQVHSDETTERLALRSLVLQIGAIAEIPDILHTAAKQFAAVKDIETLEPSTRGAVCSIAVRYGTRELFKKAVKLHNQSTSAEVRLLLSAAASSTRNSEDIQTIISMLHSKFIRPQDVKFWFAWLLNNEYSRHLAWQWMQEQWHWIQKEFSGGHIYDTFPRIVAASFSRSEELKEYTAFFEPKMRELALQQAITLGIEEVTARVAWRTYNEEAVQEWLAKE